jgi:hypothetical protein
MMIIFCKKATDGYLGIIHFDRAQIIIDLKFKIYIKNC